MKEILKKNCEIILDELKKGGDNDGEVFATYTDEMKVIYENKDFSMCSNNETSMFGIRTLIGGRLGFSTTNSTDEESLREAAREALTVAKLSPPSEHHQIAGSELQETKLQDSWDDELASMPISKSMKYAQMVVDEARKSDFVTIDRAEYGTYKHYFGIANSKGVNEIARQAQCSGVVMGMAKKGEQVTSFDYDGFDTARANQIESNLESSIKRFRDSVVMSLDCKKGESYKGRILLHPSAVMGLIGGHVAANCNGRSHQDGMSSWKGKLGEKVSHENLHIYEDPRNIERPSGWMEFDREGVRTEKHHLIENGKLNFIAHNCFSAHREGIQPTGNATGGSRSLPGIGFSNLTVEAAKEGMVDEELFKYFGDGLVVKRFSGNADPTSGKFSGVAKNSWWKKNGEYAFPVQEVMISGDMNELLQNIVAMGNMQHDMLGGGRAPFIIVDGISVTAN